MTHTWKWGLAIIGVLLIVSSISIAQWEFVGQQLETEVHNTIEEKGTEQKPTQAPVNNYYIGKIRVDVAQKQIAGTLQVNAINKSSLDQKAIYFHLYPNVFRESDKLRGENWDYVLGQERKSGWINIERVFVNEKESMFHVKETNLEIPLEHWGAQEQVSVTLEFQLQVPQNEGRLSYDEHGIWLGNWLPIVAEYDDQGWYLDPYYPIGESFYSEVANYDLEIDLPIGYQIASSGIEAEKQIDSQGERQVHKVSVERVRDFSLVIMDEKHRVLSDMVDGLVVNTWYRESDDPALAKKLHQVGIESLQYYSDAYGRYPYKEYDIVRTGGFFGGMEYPGVVFIQGRYFESDNDYGILVVAHETAHQWWYGLVGNNEVTNPWMDESLTEYSTLRFLMDHYDRIGKSTLKGKERSLNVSNTFERKEEYVGSSVDQFSNWDSYGTLVYNKGSMMFYELEQAIGVDMMNQILNDYFTQFVYRNANDEDLIRTFENHLGARARSYFQTWLEGGQTKFNK